MARPVRIDLRGGAVLVTGVMLEPIAAPLKIDLWRRVRHPPPDLVHVATIKDVRGDTSGYFAAGHPGALLGKVLTWTWICSGLPRAGERWRVRVDVRQDGRSVADYPAEYAGPLPTPEPLAQLKISESVEARE